MSDQPPLPDGSYDVFIVDAMAHPDDEQRVVGVEITITAGEHKGASFALAATGLAGSDIELIGLPATLTVVEGEPKLTLD